MKNKKGFTLVEILAVIVILAVLITFAVPAVGAISRRVKQNMYESKIKLILAAAKLYGEDNKSEITNDCTKTSLSGLKCLNITVQDLLDDGYITEDKVEDSNQIVIDPRDNSSINDLGILVYIKNNRVYAIETKLFDIDAYRSNGSSLAFDVSGLVTGKTYKIKSDKLIARMKIAMGQQYNAYYEIKSFYEANFTMPSCPQKCYMYFNLNKDYLGLFVNDTSELDGYNITITEVN